MENPYLRLHGEFRAAGAEVLLSSGQACVVFGIAWKRDRTPLAMQHTQLAAVARVLLETGA
jgi:hypothetical protein